MPNLNKFKYKSKLISVIPPATAVAWASFSTGNNPGKTEIYDFTILDDARLKILPLFKNFSKTSFTQINSFSVPKKEILRH